MKNTAFIASVLLVCCGLIQFAHALKPDQRVTRAPLGKYKRENQRPRVFLNNFSNNKLRKRSRSSFFLINKCNASNKRYFDILRKSENKKRRKLFSPSKTFPTHKERHKLKLETNKFKDKNGDGINDIVTNPKL